jgi:hypothetical protein
MKQLNNEQIIIVDDILYEKIKNNIKPFHIFLTSGARIGKMFNCVLYKTCYDIILKNTDVNPLKPKIMKLAYIGKKHLTLIAQQYILNLQFH